MPAYPEWTLAPSIRHLKRTMRLATAELAHLAEPGFRTVRNIDREQSDGTVQTMNACRA